MSQWSQIRLKNGTLLIAVARFSFKGNAVIEPKGGSLMTSISFTAINSRILGLNRLQSRATTWHLWRVFIPRRTITGRLVRGQVLRRHNGRRWVYTKFLERAG